MVIDSVVFFVLFCKRKINQMLLSMKRKVSILFLAMMCGATCFAQTAKVISTEIKNQNGRKLPANFRSVSFKYLNDSSCVYYDNFENFQIPRFASKISYNDSNTGIAKESVYENINGDYTLYDYDEYEYFDSSVNGHGYLRIISFDAPDLYYSRELYEYDGTGLLLSLSQELYDVNTWKKNRKWMYFYNENGTIDHVQNLFGDNWEALFTDYYEYNGSGKIAKIERISEAKGEPINRKVYVYQEEMAEEILTEKYDLGEWKPSYKLHLSYDDHNNVSETVSYWYNGDWESNFRFLYKYDNAINIEETCLSMRYDDLFDDVFDLMTHPVTEVESYMKDYEGWEKISVNKYFFTENDTINTVPSYNMKEESFVVFPNPVQEGLVQLHFEGSFDRASVRVFNLTGNKVLEKTVQSDFESLDFSGLAPGVYFVEFVADKAAGVRKVVKNR